MKYLSGAVRKAIQDYPDMGFMMTPNMGNRPDLSVTPWAADTGCFSSRTPFRLDKYLSWLVSMVPYRDTCLFATAPDVVPMHLDDPSGAASLTWARSKYTLPVIRALGFAAALVAQNGLEDMVVPWDDLDALFVGGTTDWKLSPVCASLVDEAKRRHKYVHMGRVNSFKRLRYAYEIGCDSADGTFISYGPDRYVPRVANWLRDTRERPSLWVGQELTA